MTSEKLYKLSTLAERADLSVRTIQKHVEKGLLDVRRVGPYRVPRVTETEFKRYLDDIKGGAFVKEWTTNHQVASKRLEEMMKASLKHPMSINEDRVIQMIQGEEKAPLA